MVGGLLHVAMAENESERKSDEELRVWDSDYECMRKWLRLRGRVTQGVGQ